MVVKTETRRHEEYHDNLVRSLKVLYAKGLLSKEKDKAVCRNIVSVSPKESTDSPLVVNAKLVYYTGCIKKNSEYQRKKLSGSKYDVFD